ncbi:MAG: UDP-3-O-(3-hydroxymyristoyl)glucosamine N-acyltransferase [Candidatus Omnitrophica bacterium]|nr:UDP-3-O-(3-hydroxymyristoyl)glucosamine N-acyltransferase [Candidatus Omnitrophota bacterium]
MEHTLHTIAEHLHGRLIGSGVTLIRGVSNLETVKEGELTFAEDSRHVTLALSTRAAAVIVPSDVQQLEGKAGISVANPKLAFAVALELFHPMAPPTEGIHPSAVLGENVQLGKGVCIKAHASIGDNVRIGQGTLIESGARLGDGVSIGEHCFIGPNVVMYRHTLIGHRVRIHGGTVIGGDGFGYVFDQGHYVKVPQVGNVVIEDDVELGCNVCVDRATIGSTVIKRGTKVDNLVQIAHNDHIGEHVMITGHVGFSGSVTVGNYAVFGGKAGVVDHVTIGERAQIGAASVVTKDVPAGETVWGFPARPIRSIKRQLAALSHLPAILQRLSGVAKRLQTTEARLKSLEQRTPASSRPRTRPAQS